MDFANFSLVSVIRRWSSSRELSTQLCWGCREQGEGNAFHGRSGCGRTRVTIFCVFSCLSSRWFEMVLTQCDFPCTTLNVKAARNSKQTRVNDKSNCASRWPTVCCLVLCSLLFSLLFSSLLFSSLLFSSLLFSSLLFSSLLFSSLLFSSLLFSSLLFSLFSSSSLSSLLFSFIFLYLFLCLLSLSLCLRVMLYLCVLCYAVLLCVVVLCGCVVLCCVWRYTPRSFPQESWS